jgi:hypothetical protein
VTGYYRANWRDAVLLTGGAILINFALVFGVHVRFGWWGLMFWLGIGILLGWVKAK